MASPPIVPCCPFMSRAMTGDSGIILQLPTAGRDKEFISLPLFNHPELQLSVFCSVSACIHSTFVIQNKKQKGRKWFKGRMKNKELGTACIKCRAGLRNIALKSVFEIRGKKTECTVLRAIHVAYKSNVVCDSTRHTQAL